MRGRLLLIPHAESCTIIAFRSPVIEHNLKVEQCVVRPDNSPFRHPERCSLEVMVTKSELGIAEF